MSGYVFPAVDASGLKYLFLLPKLQSIFQKPLSCRILKMYLIARSANWVSFPGPYSSFFSTGEEEKEAATAGD